MASPCTWRPPANSPALASCSSDYPPRPPPPSSPRVVAEGAQDRRNGASVKEAAGLETTVVPEPSQDSVCWPLPRTVPRTPRLQIHISTLVPICLYLCNLDRFMSPLWSKGPSRLPEWTPQSGR